jgi:hypothetical protein
MMRQIAGSFLELAAAGYLNEHGGPFAPNSIRNMLAQPKPERSSDDGEEEATS